MLRSLPDFVNAYWMYLAGGAVFCAILSYFSKKFFSYLQKALILCAVLFAVATGYELLTGKSLLTLPGSIERRLDADPSQVETGHRYYKSYEERYGDKAPQ